MDAVQFVSFIQDVGFTGLLVILAVPSLRKKIFNGNGNGDYKKLQNELSSIRENHLHEIKTLLDDQCQRGTETLAILKEFKEYGIKIRKK